MTTDYLNSERVSDAQRDRAVDYLQQAYAAGGMDPDLFEDRLGQALTAETRGELNRSLRGIARLAAPNMPQRAPVARPASVEDMQHRAENVGAGLVHLSGLPTAFVVPAIVKAVSRPGSRIWWEASRSMSFQATSVIVGFSMFALTLLGLLTPEFMVLSWLFYVVLTLVFSTRAFQGQVSTGFLADILPFRATDPDARPRLSY